MYGPIVIFNIMMNFQWDKIFKFCTSFRSHNSTNWHQSIAYCVNLYQWWNISISLVWMILIRHSKSSVKVLMDMLNVMLKFDNSSAFSSSTRVWLVLYSTLKSLIQTIFSFGFQPGQELDAFFGGFFLLETMIKITQSIQRFCAWLFFGKNWTFMR